MSDDTFTRLCPAKPSKMKILGKNLVDQLLEVEHAMHGQEQFHRKKEIISHFQKHEPDLFSSFQTNSISPYQFLVKVQRAFENQSDVTFAGNVFSKYDAVVVLKRYIPNIQYLHDNQLRGNSDTFMEFGTSVSIGVAVTGLTEAFGRGLVSNPYLSMETAIIETAGIAFLAFAWFVIRRNRSFFHKAPWNSAIYLAANLHESNPNNWEKVTWKSMENISKPFEGFTLLKNRPHYEALDAFYTKS